MNGWNGLNQHRLVRGDAVGSLSFVDKVKSELGFKAAHREVMELDGTYTLREEGEAYGRNFGRENDSLSLENTQSWNEKPKATAT